MSIFDSVKYKDIDWKSPNGTVKAHVSLSMFGGRFKEAQIWLDNRINLDMMPYIPFRTGAMQGAINAANNSSRGTGKVTVYAKSYGRRVYSGITESGAPMHYTNPLSTPRWFDTVKSIYGDNWKKGVEDIIKRR